MEQTGAIFPRAQLTCVFRNKCPLNNSQIEMHQSQQTTKIHNAVPQPVDPIT